MDNVVPDVAQEEVVFSSVSVVPSGGVCVRERTNLQSDDLDPQPTQSVAFLSTQRNTAAPGEGNPHHRRKSRPKGVSEETVVGLINSRLDAKFDEFKAFLSAGHAGGFTPHSHDAAPVTSASSDGNKSRPTISNVHPSSSGKTGEMDCPSSPVRVPVIRVDDPDEMGSLAGTPARAWRPSRPSSSLNFRPEMATANSESRPIPRLDFSGAMLSTNEDHVDSVSICSGSDGSEFTQVTQVPSNKQASDDLPASWSEMVLTTKKILKIPDCGESEDASKSILAASFETSLPSKRRGVLLPADQIIKDSWNSIYPSANSATGSSRSVRFASYKKRHREQYRWSEEDFREVGKVPELDGAVSTYLASGKNQKGVFTPRTLFPEEVTAEATLRDVDSSLRTSHRVVSHASFILAALSDKLQEQNTSPDSETGQLLSGLAACVCDFADLSVRASARCLKARRDIYLKAMNLPDARAKADLLKVSPLGDKLFGGQVERITHQSSELVRDIRETARNYATFSGPDARKRKLDDKNAHSNTSDKKKFRSFNSGKVTFAEGKPSSSIQQRFNRRGQNQKSYDRPQGTDRPQGQSAMGNKPFPGKPWGKQ